MISELEYLKRLRAKISRATRKVFNEKPHMIMPIYESLDVRIKALKANKVSLKDLNDD